MGSGLAFAAAFPVVEHEPYVATVRSQSIETTRDGARELHEALNVRMRDSAGRIRDEQLASAPDAQGGSVQGAVHILDPTTMRDTRWDDDSKTFLTADIPASYSRYRESPLMECSQSVQDQGAAGSRAEESRDRVSYQDLGRRTVDGLDAVGCRVTRVIAKRAEGAWSGTVVIEVWNSPELQINLLTTEKDSDGTERSTRLSNLHRVEPDAALFAVPSGYTNPTRPARPAAPAIN